MATANIVKVVREDDETSQTRDKSGGLDNVVENEWSHYCTVRDMLSLKRTSRVTRHVL